MTLPPIYFVDPSEYVGYELEYDLNVPVDGVSLIHTGRDLTSHNDLHTELVFV
jgi:hypothetical protein